METKTYTVSLNGCDDRTSFEVQLTDAQKKTVDLLVDLSEKISKYSCQPVMKIEEK